MLYCITEHTHIYIMHTYNAIQLVRKDTMNLKDCGRRIWEVWKEKKEEINIII